MAFYILRDLPPPVEFVGGTDGQLGIARYEAGKWHIRFLFPIPFDYCREARTAPDRQSIYFLTEATLWAPLKEEARVKILSDQLLACVFSPNGRYLLGNSIAGFPNTHYLSLLDPFIAKEVRELSTGDGKIVQFGWYPDNRSIWYAVQLPAGHGPKPRVLYYQQDVSTGRRRSLSAQEVRQLDRKWGLKDQRFCIGRSTHVYSRHQKVRLRLVGSKTERIGVKKVPIKVHPSIYCEWQTGKRRLVLGSKQHPWRFVGGLDVTDDGRWVLLKGTVGGNGVAHSTIVLVDAKKQQVHTTFPLRNYSFIVHPGIRSFALFSGRYGLTEFSELCYFKLT